MSSTDALRQFIIEHCGDDRLIARRILLAMYRGDLNAEEAAQFQKHLFRLTGFVTFFQYLAVYLIATQWRFPDRRVRPNSPRVESLFAPFSTWLKKCLVDGRPTLPMVDEAEGMAFVDTVLDGAEGLLLCLRAEDAARRVSELRRLLDEAWRDHGTRWALSSAFSSHIGHFAYAASFLTLQQSGDLKAPPIVMLKGQSILNPCLWTRFQDHMVERLPADIVYAELISARKRHSVAEGGAASMSELVSRAVCHWSETPYLAKVPDLEERGATGLLELGVAPDDPVVTVHVREEGYNEALSPLMHQRDARFDSYGQAVRGLVADGFKVVRLGDNSMTPAPAIDGLIDYPFTAAKSDWMDIYLAGRCAFHIGTSSGMSFIPLMFGRPVLFTNFPTLAHMVCAPSTVTLPKVLQTDEGETIPFEVFCRDHSNILEAYDAVLHGLRFVDNNPADLADAAAMMVAHLDGETGRVAFPEALFSRGRSSLPTRPQIPDWFLDRHYPTGSV